ncbi:hypothetical protein TNCV_4702351 [Trichonephila clavipes]|nr:hypothetical protein TNCV_4702351 [Trichonephila clavipes]
MDIIYRQTSGLGIASQDIEDTCVAAAYLKMDKQDNGFDKIKPTQAEEQPPAKKEENEQRKEAIESSKFG